jgi:hypothetical protein
MFQSFVAVSLMFTGLCLYTILRPQPLSLLWNVLHGPIFSFHMAAISGVAAWTIWNGKTWARAWAIAASLMYILMFLRQFIISSRPGWDHNLPALFLGLLGLLSFVWPDKPFNASPSGNADSD